VTTQFDAHRKGTIAALILLGLLTAAADLAAQVSASVDYDTFMKQDVQGRIRTFNQISAENRAELVRTQIQRWKDANRARLTPGQLNLIEEWLALATAFNYRTPITEEQKARVKDLEVRSAAVFSREDMTQALTIQGTYIPKQESR